MDFAALSLMMEWLGVGVKVKELLLNWAKHMDTLRQ